MIFHASPEDALVNEAVRVREQTRVVRVRLTDGCFQFRSLTEAAAARL